MSLDRQILIDKLLANNVIDVHQVPFFNQLADESESAPAPSQPEPVSEVSNG